MFEQAKAHSIDAECTALHAQHWMYSAACAALDSQHCRNVPLPLERSHDPTRGSIFMFLARVPRSVLPLFRATCPGVTLFEHHKKKKRARPKSEVHTTPALHAQEASAGLPGRTLAPSRSFSLTTHGPPVKIYSNTYDNHHFHKRTSCFFFFNA